MRDLSDFTFGQLLSQLLTISKLKSYVLANYLNYDVSYISKWVTGSMLPAAKHVHKMCKEIATIIVDSSEENGINELCELFKVNEVEALVETINQALLASYQRSNEKSGRSKAILLSEENNSHMVANPHLQQQYMRFNSAFVDKKRSASSSENAGMVMMIDLFALSKEDKLHISELNIDANFKGYVKEVHYLLSLNAELMDEKFDALLITYLLNNTVNFKFSLSQYKNALCSLMFVIQNYCIHLSILLQNHRVIFSDTSYDKKVVSEMYDTLISVEESFAKPLVESNTVNDIILGKQYLSFVLSSNIDLFISQMDEFLLPNDVFEELLEQSVFVGEKRNEILNAHHLFKNAILSSNVRIAILEGELQNYALNGHISFYGKKLKTTFEQREKHLNYIVSLLKQTELPGQISIVNRSCLRDFSYNFAPCIYLSDLFSFVRITADEQYDRIYTIESENLKNVYMSFANYAFNELAKDEFTKKQVVNCLNMIRLLKN